MNTKTIALAALTLVIGAGTASAQYYDPRVTSGKGNSAGGYLGAAERHYGVDPTGTEMPAGRALRVDPRLATGKGNQAGGYRGYVERRLGIDPTGTTYDPGPALRVDPRLATGKGNQAGGYRGYYERRLGIDTDDTGSVTPGYYGPRY